MNVKNLSKVTFLLCISLLFGCGPYNDVKKNPSISGAIVDNQAWYKQIDPFAIVSMSISIPEPNDFLCSPYSDLTAPPRPCTLNDIDNDNNPLDTYVPQIHVLFESENFVTTVANASMEQKGKSTRQANQASYRIKLDSKTNLLNAERTFQLDKHFFDSSRIKNKLFFDTFIEIPNFTSLRTQFVDLSVNGINYGLFTHIEFGGKEFLLNRGWNKDDNLYKAQNFSFYPSSAFTLDANGDPVDLRAFDASIELKRGKDREKFVNMINELDRVARNPQAFELFFQKYFDRQNYITWLAINIIVSNRDTISQNFYLLNPIFSDKFYFLPWDYNDVGESNISKIPKWGVGISNWWDVPLHKAFLSNKVNRDELDAMVTTLRAQYFSDAKLQAKIDTYKTVVEPYIRSFPDNNHLNVATWIAATNDIIPQIARNMQRYRDALGSPMPFWQSASYANGVLSLSWGRSSDLEGDELFYDLTIASDMNMSSVVFSDANVSDIPTLDATNIYYTKELVLAPGTYYMKVIAKERNNPNSYQIAFDFDFDQNGNLHEGVLPFNVN